MRQIGLTATWMFDVRNANTDEAHAIYRCDSCMALVQGEDVQDHLAWHSTTPVTP